MEERSLATLKSILTARGFADSTFEPLANILDETRMFTYEDNLVIFSEKTRVTEKEFNNFVAYADENGYSDCVIIITPTKPSEKVLSVLRSYIADHANRLVQIFEIRHLQLDIAKHRKVPRHRIISADEKGVVMKEFNISDPSMFPKIDCQDPMAKWIGARPDDIVEVGGMCESSGTYRRYRLCVPYAYDT